MIDIENPILRRAGVPRDLKEVYFIWMEKSIVQYLMENYQGSECTKRLAVYTGLAWIHNEFNGKALEYGYAEMLHKLSGVNVKMVRTIINEFEELGLLKVRRSFQSSGDCGVKQNAILVFDPSGSDLYQKSSRISNHSKGTFSSTRESPKGLKQLSIYIDRSSIPLTTIINNSCSIPTGCEVLDTYLQNFDYQEEIIPLVKKWNEIASESEGKVSRHVIPETKEEALTSQSKTLQKIVQAVVSLRTGKFVASHKVIPPNGYGEDRPYSLEEIMAVLHNIYLYFKNIGDYKTRFIPKSLAQLFVNTNPNSKSFEESMFLKLLHHPIIPDTLGGKKSIQKHVSQEVYDNYRFTLFHDINAEEQSTLWFMIGKVYWMYKAVTKDLHAYYKNHDNWQMIFGSFETFASYHIDFIKQTYGHVDIHVGFLAVDKKVWQRFTEAMEVDFQIIMYPTELQRLQLENDRYVRYVEKQGLSPDNFDDDFRSRESRIDHDRNKIIDLQTKRAERAVGNK